MLLILLFLASLMPGNASAVLTIQISGGVEAGMPIAVVPFEWRGKAPPPVDLRNIIAGDLYRSGRFEILPVDDYLSRPSDNRQVRYKDWRLIKAEALVVGRVRPLGADRFEIQFQLFDVFREQQLVGHRWEVGQSKLRKVAHQVSDLVFKTLTGNSGAFDSRIAYVEVERIASTGPTYRLMVADSDGFNPRKIVASSDSMLSPAWSPDGRYLAYVSFEDGRSKIVIQEIKTGNRMKVSERPGINGAPAWSPDGKRLAVTLSHEGSPEIYLMDIEGQRLQRLTNHSAIDTEPAWAPNGKSLVFTSDRSGRPQIYRVSARGGKVVRLTFEGKENACASFSPDGKNLVMVTNQGKGQQIGVFSLSDKSLRILTDGPFDESPAYAPNGSMVLYATQRSGREIMEFISTAGRARQVLRSQKDAIREPAWAPLNR